MDGLKTDCGKAPSTGRQRETHTPLQVGSFGPPLGSWLRILANCPISSGAGVAAGTQCRRKDTCW